MREYKTIGPALKARAGFNARIAVAVKQLDELRKLRDALDENIGSLLKASGQDRATANGLQARWRTVVHTAGDDWDVLWAWVKRSGNTQVLYKRLNQKACEEILGNRRGKAIPGTKVATETEVQIVKAPS